jgi:hypothetical protein
VPRAYAFVSEDATHLVHALETADDEPFQVQLRRDAQRQVHPERVVKRRKRLGIRAPRPRLQHRRLHLHERAVVQKPPYPAHNPRARSEHVAHFRGRDEVQIALPISRLDVGEALKLIRQRQQRLGEHLELVHDDGQLALLRPLDRPARADDIAHVAQVHDALERPRVLRVHALDVQVQL